MPRTIIATDNAGWTRSPLSQAVMVGNLAFVSVPAAPAGLRRAGLRACRPGDGGAEGVHVDGGSGLPEAPGA
jgi:hypothetical protein